MPKRDEYLIIAMNDKGIMMGESSDGVMREFQLVVKRDDKSGKNKLVIECHYQTAASDKAFTQSKPWEVEVAGAK